jgi:hypothetical protein
MRLDPFESTLVDLPVRLIISFGGFYALTD